MTAVAQVSKFITKNNPPWAWPFRFVYGLFYQLLKRSRHKPITTKLFNGKTIKLYPDCPVSSQFIYTSIPDKQEIMKLRSSSKPQTTFLDIGANMGAYSVMLFDCVNRIIAFEPDDTSFARLKDNVESNAGAEVNLEKVALSNYVGQGKFSNFAADPTNKLLNSDDDGVLVTVTTLDDYALKAKLASDRPYILKIDVEGEELKVLQGARNFLNRFPIEGILFESFESQIPMVREFLEKLGYCVTRISHHNYWASKS